MTTRFMLLKDYVGLCQFHFRIRSRSLPYRVSRLKSGGVPHGSVRGWRNDTAGQEWRYAKGAKNGRVE